MENFKQFLESAGYYKGVPNDKKDDREAHFKRNAEKPGDGPDKDSNYKPAPGDFKDGKRVKTKPSKHTKKYKQMYGEEVELNEDATKALKNKADKTGMPLGILRQVYNRGVAAWKSGHRPGTTPEQWGMARVNSFVTKSSGTWGKADKDLAAKVRKEETMNENKEDTQPASPDEMSMAVKQAEYIGYVAREVKDHLEQNKEFPEWMQNKLTKLHTVAESMHSTLGAHGEMDESKDVSEEVAANSVAGGGVDMNPTGYAKRDKRKREDTDAMYRRNLGLNAIRKIMKERSAK